MTRTNKVSLKFDFKALEKSKGMDLNHHHLVQNWRSTMEPCWISWRMKQNQSDSFHEDLSTTIYTASEVEL